MARLVGVGMERLLDQDFFQRWLFENGCETEALHGPFLR
jgi:hypothetical protein